MSVFRKIRRFLSNSPSPKSNDGDDDDDDEMEDPIEETESENDSETSTDDDDGREEDSQDIVQMNDSAESLSPPRHSTPDSRILPVVRSSGGFHPRFQFLSRLSSRLRHRQARRGGQIEDDDDSSNSDIDIDIEIDLEREEEEQQQRQQKQKQLHRESLLRSARQACCEANNSLIFTSVSLLLPPSDIRLAFPHHQLRNSLRTYPAAFPRKLFYLAQSPARIVMFDFVTGKVDVVVEEDRNSRVVAGSCFYYFDISDCGKYLAFGGGFGHSRFCVIENWMQKKKEQKKTEENTATPVSVVFGGSGIAGSHNCVQFVRKRKWRAEAELMNQMNKGSSFDEAEEDEENGIVLCVVSQCSTMHYFQIQHCDSDTRRRKIRRRNAEDEITTTIPTTTAADPSDYSGLFLFGKPLKDHLQIPLIDGENPHRATGPLCVRLLGSPRDGNTNSYVNGIAQTSGVIPGRNYIATVTDSTGYQLYSGGSCAGGRENMVYCEGKEISRRVSSACDLVRFSADDRFLAVAGGNRLRVFEVTNENALPFRLVYEQKGNFRERGKVESICKFHPRRSEILCYLETGRSDSSIVLVDVLHRIEVTRLPLMRFAQTFAFEGARGECLFVAGGSGEDCFLRFDFASTFFGGVQLQKTLLRLRNEQKLVDVVVECVWE